MDAPHAAVSVSRLELVIEGGPRPRLGQALRELWAFRYTVLAFVGHSGRVKEKQMVFSPSSGSAESLLHMDVSRLPRSNR